MPSSSSLPTRKIILTSLQLLLIGCLCIVRIDAGGDVEESLRKIEGAVRAHEQREFDYFKLSLQWPGTYCRKTKHCCSKNACCRGDDSPAGFTIHGLWPDYNDGTWPSCCANNQFDVKEISTLLDALEKYWPSLSCGSSKTCSGKKGLFWAHEYEKHGTCCSSVVGDEYNYFLTTLNLYFKYNVTEVLYEAGYVPSNSEKYPVGGIISAIQNAFHVTPELICSGDAVEELRICLYKNFEPRECATDAGYTIDMVTSTTSCPKYVSLPAYVSPGVAHKLPQVSSL